MSPDAGNVEDLLEILGREGASRALPPPDHEEIPVYEPEALVW